MNAPRITGVWNTTFQNALQSTSRIRFKHQSGPPPCSAPKTSVPAFDDEAASGPLTLAEPEAASASAANTTPTKNQSLRRGIDFLLSRRDRTWHSVGHRTHRRLRIDTHRDCRWARELAEITSANADSSQTGYGVCSAVCQGHAG